MAQAKFVLSEQSIKDEIVCELSLIFRFLEHLHSKFTKVLTQSMTKKIYTKNQYEYKNAEFYVDSKFFLKKVVDKILC
jgi:hypothetical protein